MEDWMAQLQQAGPEAAWDLFLDRYRRLIFAAIRHYAQDYDDVMDVFARVCEALREDDLRKLRAYAAQPDHRARCSTWLVTVVRHLTVDWFRHRDGRRHVSIIAEQWPALRRRIFEHVFIHHHSHVAAYEMIRAEDAPALSFGEFLAELRTAYRAVTNGKRGHVLRELWPAPPPDAEPEPAATSPGDAAERSHLVEQALGSLDAQDRTAVAPYIPDQPPARPPAAAGGAREVPGPGSAGRRRSLQTALPPAAAAVLLVLAWPRHGDQDGSPSHRSPPGATALPVPRSPAGVVAQAETLRWTPVAGADRYRVTLFDGGGRVLFETQLADTLAALPDSILLDPGRPYLWKVEARTGWQRWAAAGLREV